MSIKPILSNAEMVCAILDGRMTVTRRVIKEPYYIEDAEACRVSGLAMHRGTNITHGMPYPDSLYSLGDILYVRETFRIDYLSNIIGTGRVHYKADGIFADFRFAPDRYDMMRRAQLKPGWRPNENMPREAARIWLRVTDVRVERLQEITVVGCKAEGLIASSDIPGGSYISPAAYKFEMQCLWDSTIKPADRDKYGWAANPWVWVIEFERCEKPEEAK